MELASSVYLWGKKADLRSENSLIPEYVRSQGGNDTCVMVNTHNDIWVDYSISFLKHWKHETLVLMINARFYHVRISMQLKSRDKPNKAKTLSHGKQSSLSHTSLYESAVRTHPQSIKHLQNAHAHGPYGLPPCQKPSDGPLTCTQTSTFITNNTWSYFSLAKLLLKNNK